MSKKALVLALAVPLSVVLCEALLQVHYRFLHGDWLFVTNQGLRVDYAVPVDDERRFALRPGYRDETTTIDALGFRGEPIPDDLVDPLVCVIGDSVPYGFGMRDADAWPACLERALAQVGTPARVLDAAVPAYTLAQSFAQYRIAVAPRYRPALLIVQAANDMSLLTHYREAWTPETTWAEVRIGASGGHARLQDSVLYQLLAARKGDAPRDGLASPSELHYYYPPGGMLAHLARTLDDNLARLRSAGVPVVLLAIEPFAYSGGSPDPRNRELALWPRWRDHYIVWEPILAEVNALFAAKADEHEGVHFLCLSAELDRHDRDLLFHDAFHYTPAGARVVAALVAAFVSERGLLAGAR